MTGDDVPRSANRVEPPPTARSGLTTPPTATSSHTHAAATSEIQRRPRLGVTTIRATGVDNALAETFFASLEKERLRRERLTTREHARMWIFRYIECFYNTHRRHCLTRLH